MSRTRNFYSIEWRPHPYYKDIVVSEFGDVWSYKRGSWHELKQSNNGLGYFRVGIGHSNPCYVHRLVAETFLKTSNNPKAIEVNHIDGCKTNNHYSNLEWTTTHQNVQHAWRIGLKTPSNMRRIRILETGEIFESISDCARAVNGIQGNISLCLSGKRDTHRGFHFEYVEGFIDENR